MWFLFWEGAFAMAYETWIGPTYLSGVAGELGLSVEWAGVLAAIPALGQVAQILGLWFFHRAPSIKVYVIRLASLARGIWAIPAILAWIWGTRSYAHHEAFPAVRWFAVTAICSCVSSVASASSGVAWMAWVRELIRQRVRGRFFGVRQRYTMGAVVTAHALAVLLVGWKTGGLHLGYGILLGLALACAATSTVLLGRVRDVSRSRRDREPMDQPLSLQALLEPLKDRKFGPIVLFGAAFNGSIQVASPFFPYFFTRELKLPMSTVSFWTVLSYAGWAIASVYWGKYADRNDRLGRPFWTVLHLMALSPAYYIFASAHSATWIGPLDYLTNGMFWAGYSLVLTTLLLDACPAEKCGLYYSVYAACNGFAGAIGNLIGGQLALVLAPYGGFRTLWAIATVLRLCVIWTLRSRCANAMSNEIAAPAAEESICEEVVEPVAS